MSINFNQSPFSLLGIPLEEPLVDQNGYITEPWKDWLVQFSDILSDQISQLGFFLPILSTDRRDKIESPKDGQIIFNSTTNRIQVWYSGTWNNI